MDDWNDHWMTEEERDEAVRKILHDRMMAENDWRDQGTEANKRVVKLMKYQNFWGAASFLGVIGINGFAFYYASFYGSDRIDIACVLTLGFTAIAYLLSTYCGESLKEITEAR